MHEQVSSCACNVCRSDGRSHASRHQVVARAKCLVTWRPIDPVVLEMICLARPTRRFALHRQTLLRKRDHRRQERSVRKFWFRDHTHHRFVFRAGVHFGDTFVSTPSNLSSSCCFLLWRVFRLALATPVRRVRPSFRLRAGRRILGLHDSTALLASVVCGASTHAVVQWSTAEQRPRVGCSLPASSVPHSTQQFSEEAQLVVSSGRSILNFCTLRVLRLSVVFFTSKKYSQTLHATPSPCGMLNLASRGLASCVKTTSREEARHDQHFGKSTLEIQLLRWMKP